jgi:hypothetical protein
MRLLLVGLLILVLLVAPGLRPQGMGMGGPPARATPPPPGAPVQGPPPFGGPPGGGAPPAVRPAAGKLTPPPPNLYREFLSILPFFLLRVIVY